MFRRFLLSAVLAIAPLTMGTNAWAAPTRLRVVAANLTSGNGQKYDEGAGARILKGLKPDVVLIQEFNYKDNSERATGEWVKETFGGDFRHHREEGTGIPNGIISRYPFKEKGEWDDPHMENRDFAWARIDVPGDKDLWAVSVHLKAGSSPKEKEQRILQVRALRQFIEKQVPAGDYLVVGGDLNTGNVAEKAITELGGLLDVDGPFPADANGVTGTNAKRARPYDWVLADKDLEATEVPVKIGGNQFDSGLVFDSRVYTPLAEVAPVRLADSAAPEMQHMAVVRDFVLPAP